MKKTFKSLFYCFLLISFPCSAQFADDFSDGDIRNNPEWTGDTAHFEVNSLQQLHLNAPAVTAKSYLVTSSEASADAAWKFWVQFDFNPSSSNYARIYLMMDKPKPDSAFNGYYLRIGGTDDDISLFRQDGTTSKILIDGRNGMLNAAVNKLSLQVTRSLKGEWAVSCDSSGSGSFEVLGSILDTVYWKSEYFGMQCVYTSTRSSKFLFDNFEITGKQSQDTIPPVIREVTALDDSVLCIRFSEEMEAVSVLKPANYALQGGTAIIWLEKPDGKTVKLHLSKKIACKQKMGVSVSGMTDESGNAMIPAGFEVFFCPGTIYDILITEIMADPDPPVSLPNIEYIELYNSSGGILNLEKWKLQAGPSVFEFPSIDLPADSFLIICTKAGCNQFPGRYCADLLSSGTLNNTGEYVGLKNSRETLIHWVNYDESFYRDDLKQSGGWSMEMTDMKQPCLGKENWRASANPNGGTPGLKNAVSGTVTDDHEFRHEHFFLLHDSIIRLYFSKPLNIETLSRQMFVLDQEYGNPRAVVPDNQQHRYIDLVYPRKFQQNKLYKLDVQDDITSCSGDKASGITVLFKKPEPPEEGDILINEILFDALPGAPEFIEFYNKSDKYISSSDLKAAYRGVNSSYGAAFNVGNDPFLIKPGSFVAAVKNPEGMEEFYHISDIGSVVPCSGFPSMSNDEGCVSLMNKSLQRVDEFCYSEKMHLPLLVNTSGVSLERMRYTVPTSDPHNWHSAASTEGYATPGALNSQFLEDVDVQKEIMLEYEIFSPDNDGYKDVETIYYKLDQPGFVANIIVFDAMGRRVRLLANNSTLGTKGAFTWDGTDDHGMLSQTGIYLIYIELHHPSGKVKQFKKTCVLGGEMNR